VGDQFGLVQRSFTDGATRSHRADSPVAGEHLGQVAPRSVLDIGCGEGQLSRVAAAVPGVEQVVGVDPTGAQLRVALQRQSLEPPGGAGEHSTAAMPGRLPFPDAAFDAASPAWSSSTSRAPSAPWPRWAGCCAPEATFLLFLNHPAAPGAGQRLGGRPHPGGAVLGIGPLPGRAPRGRRGRQNTFWIPFVHRTLSVYVNASPRPGST